MISGKLTQHNIVRCSRQMPQQPHTAPHIVKIPANKSPYVISKYVGVANNEIYWCFQNIVQTAVAVTATPVI